MKLVNYTPDPERKPQLTPEQETKLAALADEDLDYSDIPELDEYFWNNARKISSDFTQPITLNIKSSVLKYFQTQSDRDYRSRINAVLESYVEARQKLKRESQDL